MNLLAQAMEAMLEAAFSLFLRTFGFEVDISASLELAQEMAEQNYVLGGSGSLFCGFHLYFNWI